MYLLFNTIIESIYKIINIHFEKDDSDLYNVNLFKLLNYYYYL